MKRAILAAVFFASLASCVSLAPPPPRQHTLTSTFSADEVAWFNSEGTGSISGQAFFQTRGGQPRTCAGLELGLYPHSAYANERLMALYGSTDSGFIPAFATPVQFSPDDPVYQQTRKTTVCDAQGNFTFTDLPAGEYFLIAAVMWTIPGREYMPQGGALLKSVTLANGKSERVILTR